MAPVESGRTGYRARLTHKEMKIIKREAKRTEKKNHPRVYVRSPGVFRKNDLLAKHYADVMSSHSINIFLQGSITDEQVKNDLYSNGFSVQRVKPSLFHATATHLYDGDEDQAAKSKEKIAGFAFGLTTMVSCKAPLISILNDSPAAKVLTKMAPLDNPKNFIYRANQFIVLGAYIKDHGKSESSIWLSRSGLKDLAATVKRMNVPADSDVDIHTLLHGKTKAILESQLGSIRKPLSQQLQAVSGVINKIPGNATGVFAKVKALRESEQAS